jgi:hypothetical protein
VCVCVCVGGWVSWGWGKTLPSRMVASGLCGYDHLAVYIRVNYWCSDTISKIYAVMIILFYLYVYYWYSNPKWCVSKKDLKYVKRLLLTCRARNGPLYACIPYCTSFCTWISYRHLSVGLYTAAIYIFPLFSRYILSSLLRRFWKF